MRSEKIFKYELRQLKKTQFVFDNPIMSMRWNYESMRESMLVLLDLGVKSKAPLYKPYT